MGDASGEYEGVPMASLPKAFHPFLISPSFRDVMWYTLTHIGCDGLPIFPPGEVLNQLPHPHYILPATPEKSWLGRLLPAILLLQSY